MYDKLGTHYFEFKQKVKRTEGSLSTVQHGEQLRPLKSAVFI